VAAVQAHGPVKDKGGAEKEPGGKAGKHQADHGQANAPSSRPCFPPWSSLFFLIFEILEILAQGFEPLLVVFAIAIFQKFMIATVHGGNFSGVLDRAPILFRPGGYFLHIGNQPVEIAAIDTVNLFDGVQVAQIVAIYNNVLAALHFGDFIHFETNPLIDRGGRVKKKGWNDARPNKRNSEDIQQRGVQYIRRDPNHKFLLILSRLFFKKYFLPFDFVKKLRFFFLYFRPKLSFEPLYFFDQLLYPIHATSLLVECLQKTAFNEM
jgi:hypothetical protein